MEKTHVILDPAYLIATVDPRSFGDFSSIGRYPGGNFASGYHGMDGIGPKQQSPTVSELACQSMGPNHFPPLSASANPFRTA